MLSEFEKLKELLFSDELKQLNSLEEKLSRLQLESVDKTVIRERVIPLFDEILLKRLESQESETVSIFAEHIAGILQKAADTNPEELSTVLKETISETIAKEIESNKDTMIDALYPIMGGMISKYVSQSLKEMVETINKRIDDGLTMDRIKRKVKSKVTGVSETELLLEESSDAKLSALFVIQKESGLLIAQAQQSENEIDDPHMVASMASAIKDFVNDWVQEQNDPKEVQILSYGNATLYIESAGSVYTIAFLDSEPGYEQRSRINSFFASLVEEYAKFFQNFDGDDTVPEVETLTQKMQEYLDSCKAKQPETKDEKSYFKYVVYVLLLGVFLWIGFYAVKEYEIYQVESEILETTGYTIDIDDEGERLSVTGRVKYFEDAQTIIDIVSSRFETLLDNQLKMSLPDIQQTLLKREEVLLQKFKGKLAAVEENYAEQLQQNTGQITVLQKWHENILLEKSKRKVETERLKNLKQEIVDLLVYAGKLKSFLDPKEGSLDFSGKVTFSAGKDELDEEKQELIKTVYAQYLETMFKVPGAITYLKSIIVEGHTDSSGKPEKNLEISKQRAGIVQKVLQKTEATKAFGLSSKIVAKGMANRYPVFINGIEDKNASRRIKIKFELDDAKIASEIKRLLHD